MEDRVRSITSLFNEQLATLVEDVRRILTCEPLGLTVTGSTLTTGEANKHAHGTTVAFYYVHTILSFATKHLTPCLSFFSIFSNFVPIYLNFSELIRALRAFHTGARAGKRSSDDPVQVPADADARAAATFRATDFH
jgi:hypothetical protein